MMLLKDRRVTVKFSSSTVDLYIESIFSLRRHKLAISRRKFNKYIPNTTV
jgi:hypothetical protein